MDRNKLVQIYIDTAEKCLHGKYSKLAVDNSTKYKDIDVKMIPLFEKTYVSIINQDTLVTCKEYARMIDKNDNNVCALNMASCFKAGGGVKTGAMAQEEELFRRTNYFRTLTNSHYPLQHGSVIYSPSVTIVKDDKYIDMSEPFSVSFIAAAAIKNPEINKSKYKYRDDYEIMIKTIDNIFKCAYLHGHSTLILGALGCGAYHNPQKEVIDIFNIFLIKYNKCFKNIVFAVYSKKDDNFDLFDKYIKKI